MTVLATTWNGNESGLLWERLWMRDEDGYKAKLVCSGVFTDPIRYGSEEAFWAAYQEEAQRFNGRVKGKAPAPEGREP